MRAHFVGNIVNFSYPKQYKQDKSSIQFNNSVDIYLPYREIIWIKCNDKIKKVELKS